MSSQRRVVQREMINNLFKALEELERRANQKQDKENKIQAILDDLFEAQRAPAISKERKIAILTSRRAGKSYLICCIMIIQCLSKPHSNCISLALTRENVKEITWKTLKRINSKYDLNIRFNETTLTAIFPNESMIKCGGIKGTTEETEKYLGAAYDVAAIDEAGSLSYKLLNYLINVVLGPALLDARPYGKLILTGTPRTTMKGIFYDATTSGLPNWGKYTWRTDSNPHTSKQYIEEINELRALDPEIEDTPYFQREYLGEWAFEEQDFVYRFNPNLNITHDGSINCFQYIVGVDIGWHDDCAFVLGGYEKHNPELYILDSFKKPQMLPDAIADTLQGYLNNYKPLVIVADTAGGGSKTISQELSYRYGIPVVAAEKTQKEHWISLINSDFIRRRIKILKPTCESLIEELVGLTWKEKPNGDMIEDPAMPNHLTDAMLYLYRHAYHYLERLKKKEIVPGSKEYWDKQDEEMFDAALKKVETQKQKRRRSKY